MSSVRLRTADNTLRTAIIDPTGTYRYHLARRWDLMEPLRSACWIMLNPSTADERINDPTIRRLVSYARSWGYNGIDVVNLFAARATVPSNLTRMSDPIGPHNDRWILDTVRDPKCAVVIVAWGSNAFAQKRAREVARLIRGVKPLHALKCNDDGSPAHPLYLKSNALPMMWEGK